jgi:hypothetical protein
VGLSNQAPEGRQPHRQVSESKPRRRNSVTREGCASRNSAERQGRCEV